MPKICIAQSDDPRKSETEISIEDKFVQVQLLKASGKKSEAIKVLDTLRKEGKASAAVYFELAKLYHDAKDINLTETSLKSAVKLDPDNTSIRQFEINFCLELGRYNDAAATIEYLIGGNPKKSDYYDQLVLVHLKKNDFENAIKTLDLKEKNIGWSEANILKKAEILDNSNKTDDAVDLIMTLAQKFSKEKKYLRLIINMLHSNDMVFKSEPYLRKILEIDPDDIDAKLGLMLISKNNITKDDFLITLSPLISNAEAPIDLKIKELLPHVIRHADTGDTALGKQLITLCDKLVIAHPGDAKSHAIYGDVLKNSGETIAAIRQYEKTLSINQKNYLVWEQLMYCLDDVENYDQLLITAYDAIDYFPNQAYSYYFAAKALTEKNDFKKANEYLDEASVIASESSEMKSKIHTVKATIAFKKKEWKKAMEWTDIAIMSANGQNASATELKGDIFKETGDKKNAEIYWNKALKEGADTTIITQKLNAIKNN